MPTSHIIQRSPGLVKQAVPLQPHIPGETFQLFDPPRIVQSPFKRVRRDTRIFKLTAECTGMGATDTEFQMLTRVPDLANPGQFIVTDLLNGEGVLHPDEDEVEWHPFPPIEVYRRTTRVGVKVTRIGAGLTGLILEFLYTQQGL